MFAKCAPQAHQFRLRGIGSGGQFITPAIASQRKESCLFSKNPTLPINWPHTHTNTVTFARAASTVQCPQGILCAQNLDLGVIKSTRTRQRLMRPNPRILSHNVVADTKKSLPISSAVFFRPPKAEKTRTSQNGGLQQRSGFSPSCDGGWRGYQHQDKQHRIFVVNGAQDAQGFYHKSGKKQLQCYFGEVAGHRNIRGATHGSR